MYCVKCGVELADSERKCPLCSTPVYFPGLDPSPEKPYPEFVGKVDKFNPRGIYFIASFFLLISLVISVICDLTLNGKITWAGVVIAATLLFYVIIILPGWFPRYITEVFVPVNFAAIALFLFYMNLFFEGEWFWTFALPITGIIALIVSSVSILLHYFRRASLYIFGGAFIALAVASIFIELFLCITFYDGIKFVWSYYPAAALSLMGLMLILIEIIKPFKESMKRIFAL